MYQPIEIFIEIFNNIEWGYYRKYGDCVMSQNMVNTQCLASSPQEVLIHQEIGILGALKWGDIPKKWAILYGEHF